MQLRRLQPLRIGRPRAHIRSRASESRPAAATDPTLVTVSDHPQLAPHPGCALGVKLAALLPPPRRAPPLAVTPSLPRHHPAALCVDRAPSPVLTCHLLYNIRLTVATYAVYY